MHISSDKYSSYLFTFELCDNVVWSNGDYTNGCTDTQYVVFTFTLAVGENSIGAVFSGNQKFFSVHVGSHLNGKKFTICDKLS